ncbi:MAG: hypothetical protein AAFN41_11970, partial [Planctomycetota bacterium]
MIETRTANGRGTTNLGWLDSRHTFAFGRGIPDQAEPHTMGFRNLRVINDDRVDAGQGFGTHGHDNMESWCSRWPSMTKEMISML